MEFKKFKRRKFNRKGINEFEMVKHNANRNSENRNFHKTIAAEIQQKFHTLKLKTY